MKYNVLVIIKIKVTVRLLEIGEKMKVEKENKFTQ